MNIFVTSTCPEECARVLDDKRVVKMVLESAQLLSTAISFLNCPDLKAPYRVTHINHPCSVWAREGRGNYSWLLQHFEALCREYTHRFGKTHRCQEHMETFRRAVPYFQNSPCQEFVNCATLHKHIEDVTLAYQLELEAKWVRDVRAPKWTCRSQPEWRY